MKPFLQLVADDLYNRYGEDISTIRLAFPNRRAALFFNRHLSKHLSRPVWQPQSTTINELMFRIAGIEPSDPLLLNHLLYEIYREETGSEESYDSFYYWGNIMIADFNQIDKYLVDPKRLFVNIEDIKEIEQQFDELEPRHREALKHFINLIADDNDTSIRSKFSKIWSKLYNIYIRLRTRLESEGTGYEGLAYRIASERIASASECLLPDTYAFIGFNALSVSEQHLLSHLKRYNQALFYWDYDEYYLKQLHGIKHEASLFITENLKLFPNCLDREHFQSFTKTKKKIRLIEAPSATTQAKLLPRIISEMGIKGPITELTTAIVLPDEQLLIPTLSAIPPETGEINITMAYPITSTSAYTLIVFLLNLQINQTEKHSTTTFFYRDVLNILMHPYLRALCNESANRIKKRIIEQKLTSVSRELFSEDQLLSRIFVPISSTSELNTYLLNIISRIALQLSTVEDESTKKNHLELEYLFTISNALTRLSKVIEQIESELNLRTYRSLFRRAMAEQRVSFYGEPLSGLQLMGFLETRNLDFQNIILLSMNDSILPGTSRPPSFITSSLRVAYGLPDYRHQNAIYAYYFYRLLQRAENIYLLYSTKSEGYKAGEMSRYILQLLLESNIPIEQIGIKVSITASPPSPITVEKDEKVMKLLNRYIDKDSSTTFLSPTALSTYKNCSLRFFFRNIANIREPEEMEETLEARETGSILHKALELIYQSIGPQVTAEKLESVLNHTRNVHSYVKEAFALQLNIPAEQFALHLTGRNALTLERIKWMVRNTLQNDIYRINNLNEKGYTILNYETKVTTILPVEVNERVLPVRIGGIIDRIDKINEAIHIIDFKTGKYSNKKVNVKFIEDIFRPTNDTDGILQTFTYSLIYSNEHPEITPPKPNLWFVRKRAENNSYSPAITVKNTSPTDIADSTEEFRVQLIKLISELFNPKIPFTQTSNGTLCRQCPYQCICTPTKESFE